MVVLIVGMAYFVVFDGACEVVWSLAVLTTDRIDVVRWWPYCSSLCYVSSHIETAMVFVATYGDCVWSSVCGVDGLAVS